MRMIKMRKNSPKKQVVSLALMLIVMLLTVAPPAFADAAMNEAINAINNNRQMINLPFIANGLKWLSQAFFRLSSAGVIIGLIGIIVAAIVFIFAGDNIGAAIKRWILGILAVVFALSLAAQIVSMIV